MLLRVLTIKAVPKKSQELEEKLRAVSASVFEQQASIISYQIGREAGNPEADEFILSSLWPDSEAIKAMAGSNWQKPHIPKPLAHLIESMTIQHFEVFTHGPR